MAFQSLILILIALTAIQYPNGAAYAEHCDGIVCLEKPPNYDSYQRNIDEIVKKNKALISKKFAFEAIEDMEPITSGDEENCMAVTTFEKPFVIKTNVSSNYVVQSKYFEQRIAVTRCKNLQSPCFGSVKVPDFGVETFCEEKLGAVSLYIYDPATKQVQYKMHEVPVCCVCKMRNSYRKK